MSETLNFNTETGNVTSSEPYNALKDKSQYVTSSLSYPSDLSGDEAGHYIQFFINEQENANIEFGGAAPATVSGSQMGGGGGTSTLSVPRSPTKRLASSIALYMPATVSMGQSVKYGEQEIGGATAAALSGAKGFEEGQDFFDSIGGMFGGGGDRLKESTQQAFRAALDAGATGAKAAAEISSGKVVNNRMEVVFEGLERRSFSFTFKLMPKSKDEAVNVDNIVKTFRFYSAPSFDGAPGTSRTFIVPATFDIEYFYQGGRNNFLNRISTCVLESCNVTFGGERVQFFKPLGKGAPPVETSIELQFRELELITREKINEGF